MAMGFYDKSTVFPDNIPFPTGVTAWRQGVLIRSGSPTFSMRRTRSGYGKADIVRKLFGGFGVVDNYRQARVNSLKYGLGWLGSTAPAGSSAHESRASRSPLSTWGIAIVIQPDTGVLESATGRTQQGRKGNDWDDWFGCDNSNLCWHYPLADHERAAIHSYNPACCRRAPPCALPNPNRQNLFPLQKQLQLFDLSGPPGPGNGGHAGSGFTATICLTHLLRKRIHLRAGELVRDSPASRTAGQHLGRPMRSR